MPAIIPGFQGEIRENELLSRHTYYKIGGPADLLVIPEGISDLKALADWVQSKHLSLFFLGRGSNLLASSKGFRGVVVKTGRLNLEIQEEESRVRAGCSVGVTTFLMHASQKGWGGFEFLAGVPATLGGVVFMNAGTHLGESSQSLESVDVFSFQEKKLKTYSLSELQYRYRKNLFIKENELIYSSVWRFRKQDPKTVKETIDETLKRRKETQPIDTPSCGSVFKNPKEHQLHAWQVIDQIGLRGFRKGDAEFSQKHCNFIVNHGNATGEEVKFLIDLAKQRAKEVLGILLEEEVQYLGF